MTYEIRKSTTKMLECLGPAGEHIWRSKLQGCWGMMPGGQGRGWPTEAAKCTRSPGFSSAE